MFIRKTLGIDLGTTNSVIALLDPTDSSITTGKDEQGRTTFPSVVGYDANRQQIVSGRRALALKGQTPSEEGTLLSISSVKRFMGLEHTFRLGPESLPPHEVSAHLLRHLRDNFVRTLADTRYQLDRAVITMPAYFNHNQIEATRLAGELAGFDVVELLHEPTAAAVFYSWIENHGDATYLVYDLGGGTFDVSVIRKRLDDYEVLGVSGDPFLGGDDFDRLTASHLIREGTWTVPDSGERVSADKIEPLFDLDTPSGSGAFARLVHIVEGMKVALSEEAEVKRYLPSFVRDPEGNAYTLEATLDVATFDRLIRDKVHRTIDCCQEALTRAKARAGIVLSDVDYIVLVGGSSRVPLVRKTVRDAFCNPERSERVRSLEPLLHEPDLCVAYGAALRAATHGTRYSMRHETTETDIELHLTSPGNTDESNYLLTGTVGGTSSAEAPSFEGGSLRIRSLATGLVEEAFLDDDGTFEHELELHPDTDNPLEVTVCDEMGASLGTIETCIRHQASARRLGQGVLPTQLITKSLQIEVLNHLRQRVKEVIAAVGSPLPGHFQCVCRTRDQAGRVVVPIFEENRVIKEMVIHDLDRTLPVGTPVEVELDIDVKHNITVYVRVRHSDGSVQRSESATIEPPPPPSRPTREEIDEVMEEITDMLEDLEGKARTRLRARADRLHQDLVEALQYDDEPKAIQRMAELRELCQNLETGEGQSLQPPWTRFASLVKHSLDLAARTADATGRDRQELFDYIHAQERYAEQAFEEHNQSLYSECWENLRKYVGYLESLMNDALPRAKAKRTLLPEEEVRIEMDRFRSYMTSVWKQVRARLSELNKAAESDSTSAKVRERAEGVSALDKRMNELARQAQGFSQRSKTEPQVVLRDLNKLGLELTKIEEALQEDRKPSSEDDSGLLEGPA